MFQLLRRSDTGFSRAEEGKERTVNPCDCGVGGEESEKIFLVGRCGGIVHERGGTDDGRKRSIRKAQYLVAAIDGQEVGREVKELKIGGPGFCAYCARSQNDAGYPSILH